MVPRRVDKAIAASESLPIPSSQTKTSERLPPTEVTAGILFNYAHEAGGFTDLMDLSQGFAGPAFRVYLGRVNDCQVAIAFPHAGALPISDAAVALWQAYRPFWIISAGFAGALTPDLDLGAVALVSSAVRISPRGEGFDVGTFVPSPLPLLRQANILSARLVMLRNSPRATEEKDRLSKDFGGDLYDCGDSSLIELSEFQAARVLVVRVIAESVGEVPSKEALSIDKHPTWAGRVGAVVGSLLRNPAAWKTIWRLYERRLIASDQLAHFLATSIAHLAAGAFEPPLAADPTEA